MQSSSNKIALVTGANKGIGFEVARQIGHNGATRSRHFRCIDYLLDGRRSLLTLLANDDKSRICSSFWLHFAESRQSTCLSLEELVVSS